MTASRCYRIGGITLQIHSDLPLTDTTFSDKLELFGVDEPGDDAVTLYHHFELPAQVEPVEGIERYRKPPWAIYQTAQGYLYLGISPNGSTKRLWKVAVFNADHSVGHIYHPDGAGWSTGGNTALTSFPSDQILIAQLLADRRGCYLHSAGAILNGAGFLFVGHSEAGKSTTTQMLIDAGERGDLEVEILCDDRNIVRRFDDGWQVYGSWSHGDIPLVSATSAPLRAICFLEQAAENRLIPLIDRRQISSRLLACVIRPFVTAAWWDKTLDVVAKLAAESKFYVMRFDKSGKIVDELNSFDFGK
ncbi:MAG TPA: hypothetical protein PKW76_08680 [bacterium]|nr:hypothetical protein [bacterium]HPG45742.1 hypothetical protein [bacterium]HPM98031.1 hypothetical protein [bacterium]